MTKYIALDIGCIECGEPSHVLGIFNNYASAEQACMKAELLQLTNWVGQHDFYVEEIEHEDTEYIPSYGAKKVSK